MKMHPLNDGICFNVQRAFASEKAFEKNLKGWGVCKPEQLAKTFDALTIVLLGDGDKFNALAIPEGTTVLKALFQINNAGFKSQAGTDHVFFEGLVYQSRKQGVETYEAFFGS